MSKVFLEVIELSVMGSLLVLMVLCIRGVMGKKLRKSVLYVMWCLVFLKLALPIHLETPFQVDWFQMSELRSDVGFKETGLEVDNHEPTELIDLEAVNDDGLVMETTDTQLLTHDTREIDAMDSASEDLGESLEMKTDLTDPETDTSKATSSQGMDWLSLGTAFWLLGLAVLLGSVTLSYGIRRSKLTLQALPSEDPIYGQVGQVKARIYYGQVPGPMVMGLMRPIIVLPCDQTIGGQTLSYVLAHELEHMRYRDYLVNPLLLLVTMVHWFNPLVWLAYYFFRRDLESFCDERVIGRLGTQEKAAYAEALLTVAMAQSPMRQSFYPVAFGERNTKRRVRDILNYKPLRWLSALGGLVVLGLVVLGFLIQNGDSPMVESSQKDQGETTAETPLEIGHDPYASLVEIRLDNDAYALYGTGFSDDRIVITNGKDSDDRRLGFADTKGHVVIEPIYVGTLVGFSEGLAYVMNEDRQGLYIDTSGQVVFDAIEGQAFLIGDVFIDGYAILSTSYNADEGNYVVNRQGQLVLGPGQGNYQYHNLGGGYFEVATSSLTDDVIGIMDATGTMVYEGKMLVIGASQPESCFFSLDGETWGVQNLVTGQVLIEPSFLWMSTFVDNRAIVVTKDYEAKIINAYGQVVEDLYDSVDPSKIEALGDYRYTIGFLDQAGIEVINDSGEVLKTLDYDSVTRLDGDRIAVEKEGLYGYMDLYGNEVLEPVFNFVSQGQEARSIVGKEGQEWYRFDFRTDIASGEYLEAIHYQGETYYGLVFGIRILKGEEPQGFTYIGTLDSFCQPKVVPNEPLEATVGYVGAPVYHYQDEGGKDYFCWPKEGSSVDYVCIYEATTHRPTYYDDVSGLYDTIQKADLKTEEVVTRESYWEETETYPLLAKIEDKDIYFYGHDMKCLLRVGDQLQVYDWMPGPTSRFVLPRLYSVNLDQDNEEEIICIPYVGSGTGVSVEDLHVFDRNPYGYYEDHSFTNYVSKLKYKLAMTYQEDDHTITVTWEDKSQVFSVEGLVDWTTQYQINEVSLNNMIVHFDYDQGIRISLPISVHANIEGSGRILYTDIVVSASVIYDGSESDIMTFSLEDISVALEDY